MTRPKPEQTIRHAERLVAAAHAFTREPDNMDLRVRYIHASFNLDWTAAAIVALAHMEPMKEPPE